MLLPLVLVACSPSPPPEQTARAGGIVFDTCRLRHVETPARCGYLEVPEDHAAPAGKKIAIHVAILPALARRKAPDPVLLFAGGPGQAASDLGRLAEALSAIRRTRDLILVDQRGTGKSKTLSCPPLETPRQDDDWADPRRTDETLARADWQRCLAELKGNPRRHRTDDYIADLERIRKALGIRKVNLWGGSYGSRVALRYMKRHPEVIRSAVLDGVAPTSLRLPNDALMHTDRLLRERFAACARSPGCSTAHPDLEARLDRLLAELAAWPATVSLRHPATGKPMQVKVNDRMLISLLWPLFYTPEAVRLVPQIIRQASEGDFSPLAATAAAQTIRETELSILQRVAVLCAEDMAGQSPLNSPRWGGIARLFMAACEGFPAGKVDAEFYEPTVSTVPTLLISGSLDPVTPPSEAEHAARTLAHHRHIVVEGWGHIASPHPCVRRVVARFFETADPKAPPLACEGELNLPPPLFYTSPLVATP
ncbi:MAG: alpha/beta fold hydrolase [Casimicrobiaceae bacterium]